MLWTFIVAWATVAHAHDLNMTGVKVVLHKDSVSVSVVAHLHALNNPDPAAEIGRRLKLRLDGEAFVPGKVQLLRDKANGIVIWQARREAAASWVAVDAPVFPERADESTVVTVLRNRQVLDEAVLDAANPAATIGKATAGKPGEGAREEREETTGTSAVMGRFLREGVAHIFLGPDHVLFLLSLLLLGGTWKQLLKIVTAFTLAHSVTLSLAATGVFSLPPRFVEPVIALSIVAVAGVNLRNQREAEAETKSGDEAKPSLDFRPWLAFGFGLIHGFGFAGALAEVGLPRETLAPALVAFNAGVELGQATIVLLVAPLLGQVAKTWPRLRAPMIFYGSTAVAAVGMFWFAQRVFTA